MLVFKELTKKRFFEARQTGGMLIFFKRAAETAAVLPITFRYSALLMLNAAKYFPILGLICRGSRSLKG